jgi:hypothetical protein
MTNIVALKAANAHRWSLMHMNAVRLPGFTLLTATEQSASAKKSGD